MNLKIVNQKTDALCVEVLFYNDSKLLFSAKSSFAVKQKTQNEILKRFQKIAEDKAENFTVYSIDGNDFLFASLAGAGLSIKDRLRLAAYSIVQKAKQNGIEKISCNLETATEDEFKAICFGLLAAEYQFDCYKSKRTNKNLLICEIVVGSQMAVFKKAMQIVETENQAISLAKNWINTPGSDLFPEKMVKEIDKICRKTEGLSLKIRAFLQLQKENFNGLVTVGKGSQTSPYMVTVSYEAPTLKKSKNQKLKKPHLVFVGKGITFDTGGLCLKPPKSMPEMVSDMAGAATVFAAILAIAKLKIPVKVSAVLCLAENRIGSAAMLPGDIFKAKNGKTIRIDNTDAEGRLILTDGLYEAGRLKATHIVDVATLTGAMVRALGSAVAGFFSNDDMFADSIEECGKESCEKFWRMPLEEEYAAALQDSFADLKNTGGDAGAIAAALFLKEFVPENTAWAHLDIAGTAFVTKKWKYTSYGATGFGVQTLVALAREMALK